MNTYNLDTAVSYLDSAVSFLNNDGRYVLAGKVADLSREVAALRIDANGPLTADQRRALFAAMRDAGIEDSNANRYKITRAILGKSTGEPVSWSDHKPGWITYGEASRLLDVLKVMAGA